MPSPARHNADCGRLATIAAAGLRSRASAAPDQPAFVGLPVVRRFELVLPDSLEACQQALADGPDVRLVAGGTDLLPQIKNGLVKARRVVDLSQLAELKVIERLSDDGA